jgi:hypothetical protein
MCCPLKWIKDLRPETLKPLQEKTLGDIGIDNYFLDTTPNAQKTRARIGKGNCIKYNVSA